MGDKPNCLSYFITFINLALSLALIILNFVWLIPVMNNSKKEEPLVENGIILAPNYDNLDLDSLRFSKGDCDKNLYGIYEDGVYETFNFKMKKIHKYSLALYVISLLQICIPFGIAGVEAQAGGVCFSVISLIPILLLNFIFFILFSASLYKRKIDEFKYFAKCSFFDETKFNTTFGFVFSVYKNGTKAFIVDLILLSIDFITLIILIIWLKYEKIIKL